MTFKIKGRLMFNRTAQAIIWRTYLQKHSLHPHLKSWYTRSECDNCEILNDVSNRRRLVFPDKVFNEAVLIIQDIALFSPQSGFCPTGFFLTRFLMRHIRNERPRGSVVNKWGG
ncbi:hypothetical protein PIB30_064160 [Stylosanthes scabra]|uniref:Uncharacterized protein n=1 Tax=Stylosanthes scabra TaxID=79078 RepID=A0ABU6WN90_9FABA|nr:hypothetical protein [Stylosanthes scabra]